MATRTIQAPTRTRTRQHNQTDQLTATKEESEVAAPPGRKIQDSFTGITLWSPSEEDSHVFDYHGILAPELLERLQDKAMWKLRLGTSLSFRTAAIAPDGYVVSGKPNIITKIEVCRKGRWREGETRLLDEIFRKLGGRRMFGEGGRVLPKSSSTRSGPVSPVFTDPTRNSSSETVVAREGPSPNRPRGMLARERQMSNTERPGVLWTGQLNAQPFQATPLNQQQRPRAISGPSYNAPPTAFPTRPSQQNTPQGPVPMPTYAAPTNPREHDIMAQLGERAQRMKAADAQQKLSPPSGPPRPLEGQGSPGRPHMRAPPAASTGARNLQQFPPPAGEVTEMRRQPVYNSEAPSNAPPYQPAALPAQPTPVVYGLQPLHQGPGTSHYTYTLTPHEGPIPPPGQPQPQPQPRVRQEVPPPPAGQVPPPAWDYVRRRGM
ncbi:hypothetical protein L198_02380 [Cryptococcus wingfieldii CBS 7118]|uniref:Uncharacterized protein n=1 Tax=Cryptococcus wingfieldii CBS 7118 TaxID=1295528 RepID=A0A1E3JUC7_9TREE|nr:hypothetical protein L198_02380 [Cryptococcus wingfieldii CBS 7118]ODO03532.1 hypothetical protein L198_02380 [Cryptococcus wingfieldii CBS 7118]